MYVCVHVYIIGQDEGIYGYATDILSRFHTQTFFSLKFPIILTFVNVTNRIVSYIIILIFIIYIY